MHSVVLGAGALGVATAHYLSRLGHRVTVIERQPGAALETSFGNGAVIHASEVEPWSQPGMPLKILKWLGREDAPMLLRLKALPHILRWGPGFLANCTEPRFVANATANLRLALYSLKSLQEIREETGIEYDLGTKGVLKIYRNPEALAAARRNCAMLAPHGLIFEELSPAQCTVREPALEETGASLCGALYFPRDEVGDCHKFVQELARYNEARGIAFRYSMSVTGLVRSGNRIVAVATSQGMIETDNVVVALGSFAPALLKQVGIDVLIYPVKGVSVTVSAAPWNGAPSHAIIDDGRMFGLIRIGDRLRAAGSAEIAGFDATPMPARVQAIIDKVLQTFPQFARCYTPGTAKVWAGLRPVSPSGVGYMGRTSIRNLFVNAGHGHLGWTMSCGAGRLVADIVAGRKPEIDLSGFPALSKTPLGANVTGTIA
jgi:D-amino-acid dehydrogenase